MDVYSRWTNAPPPSGPALLLEGDWPKNSSTGLAPPWSLDALVDARLRHLDAAVVELAEQVGGVHTLRLRYYLLKLLRVSWFFRQGPGRDVRHITAHLSQPRDADYALLLHEIALVNGAALEFRGDRADDAAPVVLPHNAFWRRSLGRLLARQKFDTAHDGRPRVILVGDARRLHGVCAALLRRGYRPCWLYDRFAVKTWWRWRRQGVGQIVLNGSADSGGEAPQRSELQTRSSRSLVWEGVDLAPIVARWLRDTSDAGERRVDRMSQAAAAQLEAVGPAAVVLDEEVTPLARAAVRWAQAGGVPSLVVQHGAPCVRFGFAAPYADLTCVWGDASRRQLVRWGVPNGRIRVTGFPGLQSAGRAARRPVGKTLRVLLLGTVPPRDDRPDSAEFCLSQARYRELLHGACSALAALAERLAAEAAPAVPFRRLRLTVRPHPRSRRDPALIETLAQFPQLRPRVVRGSSLRRQIGRAHVAIGCASSSAIEAAHWGVAAMQLMPVGSSAELFDADDWGLAATCRDRATLQTALWRLLPALVAQRDRAAERPSQAVAAVGVVAAENVVRELRNLLVDKDAVTARHDVAVHAFRPLETAH